MDDFSFNHIRFSTLWHEARIGKSIARILINHVFSQWQDEIKGIVLDLACGDHPSYRRIWKLEQNKEIHLLGVDYNQAFHPTVVADLTRPLPFEDAFADTVILASFLNIPENPEQVLRNIRRVIKVGGKLFLTAPLIFPYNPEPTDYWRFTEASTRLLVERAGFTVESLVPIGGRWASAAYILDPFLRPRQFVTPIAYWFCLKLDIWTMKRFKHLSPCPLAYVAKVRAI